MKVFFEQKEDVKMTKDTLKGANSILGLSDITENKSIWRMLVAEFLGTFLLVVVGCGSIITLQTDLSPQKIVQIALTFGLAVGTLVQCIGHVSGCHINPAVTLSLFATGDIKLLRALFFIVVQCLGAAGGSGVLKLMVTDKQEGNLGITNLGEDTTQIQGFLTEAVLTFLLLFVIHAVCDPRRTDIKGSAALAIGLTVTACHLSGIPISGSSVNPARSFGPALVTNFWENHWIYWAGPILGGVVAGLIYKFIFKVQKGESDSYDF